MPPPKPAAKPATVPDAGRETVNARFRVTREVNATVDQLAMIHGETKTLVAVALVRVAARHEDEVLREVEALRRGGDPRD